MSGTRLCRAQADEWHVCAGVELRVCVRLERRPPVVGDGGRVRNTCARLPVAKGGKPVSDDCR